MWKKTQNIDNPTVAKMADPPFRVGGLHDRLDDDRQSSVRSLLQSFRFLKISAWCRAASSPTEIWGPA